MRSSHQFCIAFFRWMHLVDSQSGGKIKAFNWAISKPKSTAQEHKSEVRYIMCKATEWNCKEHNYMQYVCARLCNNNDKRVQWKYTHIRSFYMYINYQRNTKVIYFMVKSARFDVTFSIFIENSFFSAFSAFLSLAVSFIRCHFLFIAALFPCWCFPIFFLVLLHPFHFHANAISLSFCYATKIFPSFRIVCVCAAKEHQQKGKIHRSYVCVLARTDKCCVRDRVRCIPLQIVTKRRNTKIERDTQMRFQMFFSSFQLPFACSIHWTNKHTHIFTHSFIHLHAFTNSGAHIWRVHRTIAQAIVCISIWIQ